MTYEEALNFKMRNGKTLATSTRADWQEEVQFWASEKARIDKLHPLEMTAAARAQTEASLERNKEFQKAMQVVLQKLEGDRSRQTPD